MRKNFVFIVGLITCGLLLVFFQYLNAWNNVVNIQRNFNDLPSQEQYDIISKCNWQFSTNERIDEIEYIRYGNKVEEIVIKIQTDDVEQFVSKNEDISSNFLLIDPHELSTGETGYYSNGKMLCIAIQILEYTHVEKNDSNTYVANLLKAILVAFDDIIES